MTDTDQPQLNPTPPRPAEVPEHEWAENLSEPAVYAGAAADDGAREQLATGPEGGVLARFREILLHTGDLDWADETLEGLSHKLLWRNEKTEASIALVRFRKLTELSRGMTLRAGDVLLTGTPSGIGNARVRRSSCNRDDVVTRVPQLGEAARPRGRTVLT